MRKGQAVDGRWGHLAAAAGEEEELIAAAAEAAAAGAAAAAGQRALMMGWSSVAQGVAAARGVEAAAERAAAFGALLLQWWRLWRRLLLQQRTGAADSEEVTRRCRQTQAIGLKSCAARRRPRQIPGQNMAGVISKFIQPPIEHQLSMVSQFRKSVCERRARLQRYLIPGA